MFGSRRRRFAKAIGQRRPSGSPCQEVPGFCWGRIHRIEPLRVCRRQFGLSSAAMADCSSMASQRYSGSRVFELDGLKAVTRANACRFQFGDIQRLSGRARGGLEADRGFGLLLHDEAASVGIAIVDKDRIDAGHACPAGNRGHDRVPVGDPGSSLDSSLEQRADDRFMYKFVANP